MKTPDITENEINKITKHRFCHIREQAFFTFMRQSGLTPNAIKKLRIKDIVEILEPHPLAPCKIKSPHEKYPTFIGEEGIKCLKLYINKKTRKTKPALENLLFTTINNPNKEINTKDVSRTFKKIVKDLYGKEKSSQMRLLSLVYFYRNNTSEYRKQLSNDIELKNDEFYRSLYETTAMPSLEIEPITRNEIYQLKKQLRKIEKLLPEEPRDEYGEFLAQNPKEEVKIREQVMKEWKDHEKWRLEHPEEAKAEEKEWEEIRRTWKEHGTKWHIQFLEEKVTELEKRLDEIGNITRKPRRFRK